MIMETDLQARGLIPMAISLAAGVAFATLLTLILVPSLLVILSDLRLLYHRLRHGRWVRRAAVEPARDRNKDLLNVPPVTGIPATGAPASQAPAAVGPSAGEPLKRT
jgi:hypothetical protein